MLVRKVTPASVCSEQPQEALARLLGGILDFDVQLVENEGQLTKMVLGQSKSHFSLLG